MSLTMQQWESLPVELEVTLSGVTMPLRQIALLQPGSLLPCSAAVDGLLTLTGGGEVLGYGRLEEDAGLRLVTLTETLA